MKAFLCHSSKDSAFTIELASHLRRCLGEVFYYEEYQRADQSFVTTINHEIAKCDVMVIVVGKVFSPWQLAEANTAYGLHMGGETRFFFLLQLPDAGGKPTPLPIDIGMLKHFPTEPCKDPNPEEARRIAGWIVRRLEVVWRSADDLPANPHLFSYEKDIIRFFTKRHQHGSECFERAGSGNPDDTEDDFETMREIILNGCPVTWPTVRKWQKDPDYKALFNPKTGPTALSQDLVGTWRDIHPRSISSTASRQTESENPVDLSFPEAGPRQDLFFPSRGASLTVAVLVSGGIAPGINAVIDGIVQRHWKYAKHQGKEAGLTLYGLLNGFRAFDNFTISHRLLAGSREHYLGKDRRLETSPHAHEGGSILGTSRVKELMTDATRFETLADIDAQLMANGVDILYIIGGDGSMRAAHALWSIANENRERRARGRPLSVIGIPKTMDNDILWVWQSFGFLSAVEKAREVIEDLWTEASSNPRLGVVQLFGSDSGFVVSHALLASSTGHCNLALIPEIEFSMTGIARHLKKQIGEHRQRIPHGLVVMAETAIPTDAMNYVRPAPGVAPKVNIGLSDAEEDAIREYDEVRRRKRRITGQTNDALRTAGLKIVSLGLPFLLKDRAIEPKHHADVDWDHLRVFTNEPRHLLRAIAPSCSDIIIGQRLGTLAVDNAVAGYTDFMISQWLTEYVMVPLKLVVLGRKRIPTTGIFWKSVLAKTGQPPDLKDRPNGKVSRPRNGGTRH